MSDTPKIKSPAEASREGLEALDGGHKKHGSTAHTPAQHESGKKFDETATEAHRGEPQGDLQK